MPYLPVGSFDNKLKINCVLTLAALLMSIYFGWNGSGGMIFAMIWEQMRGKKIGSFGYFYIVIIAGSLLM
jgi:hypothetical protein